MLMVKYMLNNLKKVCKLKKSLYGLWSSPRNWNNCFDKFMKGNNFEQSKCDTCLYIKQVGGNYMYVVLFVDDILTTSSDIRVLEDFRKQLKSRFMVSENINTPQINFLGLEIN